MKVYFPGYVFLWKHKDVYAANYNQNSINGTFGVLYIWNSGGEVITSWHEFGKFLVFHLSKVQITHKNIFFFFFMICTY